ncbi:DUF192 domain-containing protein [beta proteobacterium MWH-UniP1]
MTRPQYFLGRLVLAALALAAATQPLQAQTLPTETLHVRFFQITAEIAQTNAQRTKGLMGRQSLPPSHGMLFVFEQAEQQCFWMRNTPLPLTIAFVADDGKIVNFADMTPFSEQAHCSAKPVKYALEMEQGWFKKRGVLVGDAITGGPIKPRQ